MKTLFRLSLLSVLFLCLASCTGSNQAITALPVIETPSLTSIAVVTQTTPLPTVTKILTATLTITPTLVQIPKSTFDASKAITQTPFPAAQCPPNQANVSIPDLDTLNKSHDSFEKTTVDILNTGGVQGIILTLSKSNLFTITRADLTHDGVPELIIENRYNIPGILSVFGCDSGQYKKMLTVNAIYDYTPGVMKVVDMNLNGMPDLALIETTCHYCLGMRIFEWNGQEFQSLARQWYIDPSLNEISYSDIAGLDGYTTGEIVDVDGNGTYEIVLKGGAPSGLGDMYLNGPYRSRIITYMWDGNYYSFYRGKYSPPEFRFQAVQDGDSSASFADYDEALAFYQDAIFNDKLKGWSAEERENLIAQADVLYTSSPTPTPLPPHNEDYLPIAAYARYRIMLLHISRGYQKEARVVYDTLQELFPEGNAGHSFAEMGRLFWVEYSNSENMKLACQQAIDYADAHPEILIPLNGPEFSFWSKQYLPADVCPFE